ncbi:MAG: alpha/beta hydrolase, partial [Pirellulaceae bacterium]
QCGQAGVSSLFAGIASPDPQVRENTLVALATLGQSAQSAAAPLLQLLSDARQSDWHLAALNVLKAVHPDHSAAEPLAKRVLDRTQPVEMRIAAVMALGEIGPAAAEASPQLVELLQRPDEDAQLRAAVAVAISRVDTGSLDSLRKALQDAHGLVRIAAAWCLGQRDPRDAEALSCLVRELGDDEFSGYAEDALVLLGEPVTAPLAAIVRDELGERPARQASVRVLGRLGATGIPHLVEHLADQDEQVADEVRHAFYNLANAENLPVLIETWQTRSAKLAERPEDPRSQTIVARLRRIILDVSGEQGGPGGAPTATDPIVAPSRAEAAPETEPAGGTAAPDPAAPAAAAAPETNRLDDAPTPIAPASPVRAQGAMETPVYKQVKVFFGTNRQPLGPANRVAVDWQVLLPVLGMSSLTMLLCSVGFALSRSPIKAVLAALGLVATLSLAYTAAYQPVPTLVPSMASERYGPQYGTERSNELAVGTCEVSIPATHQYGELEAPSVFKLEFRQDPNRHILVQSVRATSRDAFYAELKSDLAQRGSRVLVFVHGYNVSFDDAARRTAQMAEDLKFAGVPLFFSWPSQGNWYEYRSDEKQVELAIPALREFLTEVGRRSGSDSIHLIAHSMGSRALTAALRELAAEAGSSTRFKQVVLAAPDIDADVFRERIAPAMAAAAQQVTLYASSNDLALVASRVFNSGDPRAGDSHRLLILPGIETVDVSDVDTSLLGHSYYGDNPTVLTDLRELLLNALPAAQRAGLVPLGSDDQRYWGLRRLDTARATEAPSDTQLPTR